ncbi:hypothetical protein [Serinibacter arcticus]|uniref:hypothetical protein n=1 Tax=Serinibacter arcticus TaxID=1655435 RepID=UPI002FCDF329
MRSSSIAVVICSCHLEASRGDHFTVHLGEDRALVVVGADVEGLDDEALVEGLVTEAVEGRCAVVAPLLSDGGDRRRDVPAGDPLRGEDHGGPAPGRLVARAREGRHVVGPPQGLERHDDVVARELVATEELQRVRDRVERGEDVGVGGGGVGVAVAVDHQVGQGRHREDVEAAAPRGAARELLLQVGGPGRAGHEVPPSVRSIARR